MQGVMAILTAGAFVIFVLGGLFLQIRRVWGREADKPLPSFTTGLMVTHLLRFVSWGLLGVVTFAIDPITGTLLIATRIPGVLLIVVIFLQREAAQPDWRTLIYYLCGALGLTFGSGLTVLVLKGAVPEIERIIWSTVLVVGVYQVLFAYPAQLKKAREEPLGNLSIFQEKLLWYYAISFFYGFFARDSWTAWLMISFYAIVALQQLVLVRVIRPALKSREAS